VNIHLLLLDEVKQQVQRTFVERICILYGVAMKKVFSPQFSVVSKTQTDKVVVGAAS